MVGDVQTGYMIVPCHNGLCAELETRCEATGRVPAQWVRVFHKPRPHAEPVAPADGGGR